MQRTAGKNERLLLPAVTSLRELVQLTSGMTAWHVGETKKTVFTNENGVYQDGVVASCRDASGLLWSVVGHSYLGGISVWSGTSLDRLSRQYDVHYNFELGEAGVAFHGTRYPNGLQSRGSIWPLGLWIDPEDGRFYCFIHNETGWGANLTSHTAFGYGEGEPDFRHIGLMTSGDAGKTWDFLEWIIAAEKPSWTREHPPEHLTGGQPLREVYLGAGDFSLFVNENDGFFYIFYTQIVFHSVDHSYYDHVYAARAPISSKGRSGTWKKLYHGAYSEPGHMGKESPIHANANVPCVTYNTFLQSYIMTSYRRDLWFSGKGAIQWSMSDDLIYWSEPAPVCMDRKELNVPYFTQFNPHAGSVSVTGKSFILLYETNGTDVMQSHVSLEVI